jgi:CMP-N-acetylneuraminic acid synthetase
LFLERINPVQLLLRVAPPNTSKEDYATFLIHSIQTEYEHNLTQQVYLTSNTWDVINKAKNSTAQMIRQKSLEQEIASAEKLREAILIELTETEAPSTIAISYLKEELKTVF